MKTCKNCHNYFRIMYNVLVKVYFFTNYSRRKIFFYKRSKELLKKYYLSQIEYEGYRLAERRIFKYISGLRDFFRLNSSIFIIWTPKTKQLSSPTTHFIRTNKPKTSPRTLKVTFRYSLFELNPLSVTPMNRLLP